MNFSARQWLALVVAGLSWSGVVLAQQSGSSGTGSSSSGSSSDTSSSNPVVGSGSGSSSSFNVFSSAPPTPPTESTTPPPSSTEAPGSTLNGEASATAGAKPSTEAPPSFNVPGFYGQGSTNFTGGTGRLAKPRFETNLTFGFGYDDNLNQTPRNTPNVGPAQLVDTGQTQTTTEAIRGPDAFVGGGAGGLSQVVPTFTFVTHTTPVFLEIPNTPPEKRVASLFSRAGLSLEMQSYTRRSLFVANGNITQSYYFNRDKDPAEYNGNLNLTYLYKFTPRLQVTAQVNSAYISQPDLSRPNTPERQTQGDLVNSLARIDLSYRVTPRLTMSLTGNYSGNRYTLKAEQTGDFDEYTTGLEARYLWNPRWTLLAEYRHGVTGYLEQTDLNSTTEYLLVGTEFILNPRLSGSLRFGEAIKSFDQGNTQSAPYVESAITYRSTARSSVQWTNRFGFEEPGSPNEERLVYRSTVNYNYMFSPKLRGSIGANLVHEITTNDLTDTRFAQDTFEGTFALEYQWSRKLSLNASYTFTLVNTNVGLTDYYRNRLFIGGQYTF